MPNDTNQTTKRGRVIRLHRITRALVRDDCDTVFVFGDNMEGRGLGGQAAAMRGEPNTIGVPTKWAPERQARAYFTDDDRLNRDVRHAIREAFDRMRIALDEGRNVVIPADGLGTGLAELPARAPKLHAMIEAAIAGLETNNVAERPDDEGLVISAEDLARDRWNAGADAWNRWDNLGGDERENLIRQVEKEASNAR